MKIIHSEGREVCRITTTQFPPEGLGKDWTARLATPDGEAWSSFGDTEDDAIENLMVALAGSIRGIERLVAAASAYRKGEGEI